MGVSYRAGRRTRVYVPFWLLLALSPFIAAVYLIVFAVKLLVLIIEAIAESGRG
jgi:hypothetical protein